MMKVIRLIHLMVFIFFIFITISCSKQQSKKFSEYNIIDSIKINKPNHGIYYLNKIDNKFICVDIYDRSNIFLFNNSGKILDCYNNKGKGPREILRAEHLSIYQDKIYILDRENGKVVILELNNNNLKYYSEFRINETAVTLCVINENTIFLSTIGKYNNISIYNKKGKLKNSFSVNSKMNVSNINDMLARMNIIKNFKNTNNIFFGNVTSGRLAFGKISFVNDSLSLLKKTTTQHKVKDEIEITQKNSKNKINVDGLRDVQCNNGKCYVLMSNSDLKNSFEVYNANGNYQGICKIKNSEKEIAFFTFSNDSNKLFLVFNDIYNSVYVAVRNN